MVLTELVRRLLAIDKPVTNLFPTKYMPDSITQLLSEVQAGEAEINPPVPLPPEFRGKIFYEREKCIGCQQCLRVCPSKAIKYKEDEEKIKIYVARCTFCSLCNDICPVDCLHMSEETFLVADGDKFSPNLIVEDLEE
ncbi:MAG: 4Fe-4S dicluster-binding protein [Candidatus Bipolaricaulota bacterium]